jgi:photosystem II stability/assembly factor-like uncharacterized protein
MKKYFLFVAYLLLHSYLSNAQFDTISSKTTEVINVLSKVGKVTLIGGTKNYIANSNNDCDSIKSINSPIIGNGFSKVTMADSNTYYILYIIGSSTIIYKTVNGGNTWFEKFKDTLLLGESIQMFDANNGVLFCGLGFTYFTDDGWDTWSFDTSGFTHPANSVAINDSVVYLESTYSTSLYYSTNQGHNWNAIGGLPNQPVFRHLYLLNDSCIYGVCNAPFSERYLCYCLNRNSIFTTKLLTMQEPYDVIFNSISEGYIVGYNNLHGSIMKTTDTGNTWIEYQTPFNGTITRIIFLNDSIALIAGTDGYLAKWNKNSFALSVVNEGNQMNNSISIHPNPTFNSQQIEIELVKDAYLEINLLSILGEKLINIHHQMQSKGNIKINSDLTDLSNGIYFYEIIIDNKKRYIKTIKD